MCSARWDSHSLGNVSLLLQTLARGQPSRGGGGTAEANMLWSGAAHGRKEGKPKEEPRPRSVVDLTQDTKPDSDRKVSVVEKAVKVGERLSPFLAEHMPNRGVGGGEPKSKNPLQSSSLSNCNGGGDPMLKVLGAEQDRCAKDPARHDENMRPSAHAHAERLKRGEPLLPSVGALHVSCSCPSPHPSQPGKMTPATTFPPQPVHSSMYTIFPPAKELGREHKVIAPTFVPSVEAYDERSGPIQIASQARDAKAKDKDLGKVGVLQSPTERCLADASRTLLSQDFSCHSDAKRMEVLREKGSVIRANSMALKRQVTSEPFLNRPGLGSPESREFLASKDLLKPSPEAEHRSCERDRFQRSSSKEAAKVYGTLDSSRQHLDHGQLKPPEQKWKPFEMGNFATTQMAVLAAQHNHVTRAEEEAKKVYLDPSGLPRSSVVGSRGATDVLHPASHGEGSAMQSLIKESKELADFARIHPSGCATNGLNSNLMVTGGPALTGSGRWSADPASHLAAHPWLPRTGSPSMWLAGHPYGLGHPSLHQGMTPGFPPAMGGALPSAYQFARDPQSGQLVVIPSEHLPHFGKDASVSLRTTL
ncbi:hypothetical protein llap_14186 [Limosa lapponica baueri]|uniref:Trinucleotide repeat-containing gene 18 protein n=1 Tax=Limosa lapponica baueri TaxID=1758121 RepID=A0A2I0TNW3_LIMLA|nr:hypothetical protein llap_14186 [Limosa lapponica baueri]